MTNTNSTGLYAVTQPAEVDVNEIVIRPAKISY